MRDRCPPQHKPPGTPAGSWEGHLPPNNATGGRNLAASLPCTHSLTQAIIKQTFWSSPRALHRRPRALFAFRCFSVHVPAPDRSLRDQSPLCAARVIFFPSFLPFLPLRNAVSSLFLPPGSPSLAGGLFLRVREALPDSCWEPWRRGSRAGVGGGQEGSACGPFKQIQRLGLFCYSSFYSAPPSAAAGERRRARMRPAAACRPARPTSPSRRERFQCASRWVLKPILQTATHRPPSTLLIPPFLALP